MKVESCLPWRFRRSLTLLFLWGTVFLLARAQAGSLVIPAWSFARGNVRIHANPSQYADAGPVVAGGPAKPWGWMVEYDFDLPVSADYTLQICYAAAEARPVEVFFDNQNVTKCCEGVTYGSADSGLSDTLTWNSSGAKWEVVRNQWGRDIELSATGGTHTVKLTRRGPLPHLVALRLDTPTAFPEDWRPPPCSVRDPESIPAEHRKSFVSPGGWNVAALRLAVEDTTRTFGPRYPDGPRHLKRLAELEKKRSTTANGTPEQEKIDGALMSLRREVMSVWTAAPPTFRAAGSLLIPAWSFDRGNGRIYASPDEYADAGPVVGSDPKRSESGMVEYDIEFPVAAEYTLHVSYAAGEARPVEVFVDGKNMGRCCFDVTFGSAPFEQPVVFTWNSSGAVKKWEGLRRWGELVKISITKGKHTVRLARSGPLPNLVALRLETSTAFPRGWKQPRRKVRLLDSVPVTQRSVFLPPKAVNAAALRLAIEDTIRTFGSRYPGGPAYLKQLAELEKNQRAAEGKDIENTQKIEEALGALRRRALLTHPALNFDKLLFVKRTPFVFNTYQDSKANTPGGSLCILSPVGQEGKVTKLAPELDGGLFSRFDLSFDAKKVVFGYKRKDRPFRIYEIDIDPSTGLMVPGSLRQLTFGSDTEAEIIQRYGKGGCGIERGFDDMDPCYLPNGKIVFASTRSMRRVFCNPSIVTTLHVMDADGKNMRCLSAGPLNEIDPCLLDDGRVVYTRWEYVDKGLGNGQSLWTVRPDGSGVEHVYKNSVVRPAQLLNARSIPGSRQLVTVGAPHCGGREGGPVILVDYRQTRRSGEAMTCITPEIAYPCMHQAQWDMGFFREPYPLSEKFFLVSHSPAPRGSGFGIYVLDRWGNRAELHSDTEISCFQPTPLRPRRKPTDIVAVERDKAKQDKTGTLFVRDVYDGMTGIERGRVKYLRVMGALPWPWQENGIFRIGLAGNVHRKKVYGVVKVHEDGSAYFAVPAEQNIFFQALDENFMALQHMPTFINLMPGEIRSCIGCHEERKKAPRMARGQAQAMRHPPQRLMPQPGETGPRMVHYATDVQPVLDKHCVGCHGGEDPKARLDLTGEVTETWNRSYENLIGRGLVSFRDCRYGRAGFRPGAPLSFGSHLSTLTERISKAPCGATITRREFVRIVTWIDANVPYYGTYRGKRDLKDKDDADFRLSPLVRR